MGRLGEVVLRAYLRKRASSLGLQKHNGTSPPKETAEDYIQHQYKTTQRILAMYPGFNVSGKNVLELGCGLGGRAAYIASLGASSVEGVDINRDEIENAQRICREEFPELHGKLSFRAVGEDDSWGRESYDVVILIDAIEHVVSPVSIVRRAYECLRPGGVMYFSSIGWFSAYGSHTGLFPFVNVFFSDLSILNAMRWMLQQPWYQPSRHDSNPPVARWEWLYDLKDRPGEHLNKITINEVRKLLRYSKFSRTHLHLFPLGHNGAVRALARLMNRLPGLRELSHGYFVATCYK